MVSKFLLEFLAFLLPSAFCCLILFFNSMTYFVFVISHIAHVSETQLNKIDVFFGGSGTSTRKFYA